MRRNDDLVSESLNEISTILSTFKFSIMPSFNLVLRHGYAKSKIVQKTKGIVKELRKGQLSNEEIAEDFNVKLNFVIRIKKQRFFKTRA